MLAALPTAVRGVAAISRSLGQPVCHLRDPGAEAGRDDGQAIEACVAFGRAEARHRAAVVICAD